MSKDSIADYDTAANSNTDVEGINIDERCAPANINDAIRTIMSHLAAYRDGRVVGSDIQAFNDNLAAFAGLSLAADKFPYSTGSGALALTDLTSFSRSLLAAEDAAEFFSEVNDARATKVQAEAGTNNSAYMTPLRVAEAIASLTPPPIGVGQTWQDLSGSREVGTSYQNTTGRPIMVAVATSSSALRYFEVSTDDSTWVQVGTLSGFGNATEYKGCEVIIPNQHFYKATGGTISLWSELR